MKLHLPLSLRCRLLATFLLAAASIYANFSTTLFSGSIPEDYTEVIIKDAKSLTKSAAEASGANVAYRLVYQDGGITVESPAQALMPSAAGSRYFTAEQAETPASLHISKAETTLFTLDSNESLSWQALGTLSYTENTSSASGGLVYASSSADLSWIGNEKVEFVGNHATNGGAIYGGNGSTITLSDNGTVSFSGNTARYYGGAIYGGDRSRITLSDNDTVTFSGNTASYGGAIYGYEDSTITLSNNDTVSFSGNRASYGGAIYGDSGTITLSNNGTVTFSGNTSSSSGGAIYGYSNSTITLSNNGKVSFSENTAGSSGGAIYGGSSSTITLSDNDTVSFSENTASGSSYGSGGGAIYGYEDSTITLSDNGTVSFSGNTASGSTNGSGGAIYGGRYSTITLSDNDTVTFSGNTASGSSLVYGGAIYGNWDSTITLSDNGEVTFIGNTASYGSGGAIYGGYSSTITLTDNDTVSFSGNTASSYGGAIYSYGNLHIRNNDSVEFAGNVEKSASSYRLRSIYVSGGGGDTVSLSAAAGKSIIFRDSMYISSRTTVDLNADYNGLKQKGDILFTGVTTEADLLAAKGRAGTAEEVLNSRTTEVKAMTNLYGGRLRVEDGAVYKGYGITVQEGSEATVRVKDATLNHKGYTLSFASGTMLELEGANSLSGDLLMKSGSFLSFVLQEATAVAGRHSGAMTVQEGVELRLQLDCEDWQGTEKTLLLIASDAGSAASCAESSLRTVGVSNALWGYKDAYWQEGNLFVDVRKTDTVTWDNAAGDYRWDHLSANWTDEGYRYSYVQGAHVVLGQSGAGTIRVLGDMAIAGMRVEGGSSYCLEWAEDSSLAVADYLRVDSRSSLDFGGDLSLVSVENQGHLTVAGDLTTLSAISGMGLLKVAGTLTAASLQAAGLTADTLTLTESGAQNRIGSDVSFAGDATVAGALAVEGSLSAQKVSIGGELSATTVQTSDLLAGSVQVQAVTADTLTLTESGAQNRIGSNVSFAGDATVAGALAVEGSLSAQKVSIGGELSAATVQTSDLVAGSVQVQALTADTLTLTDAGTQSRIGSDVALSGAAAVAGGLKIEGAFSAASLQAGSLSAESLTLTDAAARNKVEGLLELRGTEVTHRVSGDLAAEMVSLAAGATLETDGVLTSSTVQMSGKVGGLTAAAFGAAEMDFVLDRKALEGLNLSHMQTATIARTEEVFAEDFSVLLNGSATESTDAAAYTYTIAGAGNEVQVTADYRWWDTRVWYRGGWVGEVEWTDHLIAGYDAVDGVETIDLGGESFAGYTLMVELEEGVSAVQVSNGALSFEYIDMFAGQLNIGPGTEVQVAELWGEGLTLSLSGEVTKLTVSEYLTVGTLAMDYATLTVKDAEVAELTGDAGSLVISEGGVVTVDSDVTLSGMRNGGSLDIGSHKLVVNGLTSEGGDVTAGEVETRSNMRTAAQFNKLVADKVTVRNSNSSTRYTDDLSVGAGSAIGELVAETLTVREGTVMLGHDERATAQELQKLTLNAATAELVLNEATSLAVTNSLSAKSGAKVQLKKDATLVYKELGIGNRQGAGMVTVDAYGLSRGATLSLEKAHVTLRSSETTELDHLLAESSVENLGSGTLKLTHADNRLTGIAATGGDVEVYNSAVSHDLQELYIASQMTVSVLLSAPEEAFDAAQEATLNVLGTASFGSEATLKANLTLQAGATLEMQGPVHMGSTVTLTAGSLLGDALLNRVQTMLPGDSTTLFTGVDKLVLFDGTTGYTYLPGDLTAADDVPASRYFTNLMGDDYVLTFRGDGSEGDLAIEMVPEPATATLSLLALAALASRRRRK